MRQVKAWLELVRFPLFGIPIVATLPGVILASDRFSWRSAVALLTALIGYWAGMAKNDYFHRHTDEMVNPHRPIPSGRISPRAAFFAASFGYILCLMLGFTMNYKAGLTVVGLVFISHLYNKIFKGKGVWGSLSLPLGIASLSVFGSLSVSGTVPQLVWYAFFATFLYDVGTHVVNSFKDIDRDRTMGILTTPLQIGIKPALILSATATCSSFFVCLLPYLRGQADGKYAIWISVALIATFATRLPLFLRQTESHGYLALKGSMIGAITFFPALASIHLPLYIFALIVLPILAATMIMLKLSKQEV